LTTPEAYAYGKVLALLTLSTLTDSVEKVVMGIWCVETARDDGALVSVVLYLLGMKPVYTSSPSAGVNPEGDSGMKTQIMPEYVSLSNLVRPDGWDKKRIDVTIITSGLFRDLYSTQASLMDNAFRVALARSYKSIIGDKSLMNSKYGSQMKTALNQIMEGINYYGIGSESLNYNYVAKHWVSDFIYYKSLGYNTSYAGECAITRIFAPPNGDYGAGISKSVQMSWTWNNTDDLAKFYLGRMGNMYSKNYWGESNPTVFARALNNTDKMIVSRNTNQYGVLDNDDFFDYWGGLSMAIKHVNGKEPNMEVLEYANRNKPYIASLETVLNNELTSRYFNPEWIKGMMNEGYSGARYISNKFVSNLLGWSVTRSGTVNNWMWDSVYNTYVNDQYNLGVTSWLKSGNNAYALISTTGTMLTAAHEGYWKTDTATLQNVANTWAQAVINHGVACCDCSCGNIAMMQWAIKYINPDMLQQFKQQLYQSTQKKVFDPSNDNPTNPTDPNQPTNPSGANQSGTVHNGQLVNGASGKLASGSSSSSSSTGSSSAGSSSVGDYASASSTDSSGSKDSSSSSSSSAGAASASSNGKGDVYEVSQSQSSSSSKTGMSIPAILAIVALVALVTFGYWRGKRKEDDY
jgi:cobaltochelatase CobN